MRGSLLPRLVPSCTEALQHRSIAASQLSLLRPQHLPSRKTGRGGGDGSLLQLGISRSCSWKVPIVESTRGDKFKLQFETRHPSSHSSYNEKSPLTLSHHRRHGPPSIRDGCESLYLFQFLFRSFCLVLPPPVIGTNLGPSIAATPSGRPRPLVPPRAAKNV